MNTIIKSELFDSWLTALKDTRAKFNILARLRRAEIGNFGDCRPVEMVSLRCEYMLARDIEYILCKKVIVFMS